MPERWEEIGERVVRAARMAAALHRLAEVQEAASAFEQLGKLGVVMDDASNAKDSLFAWTGAGENPARSFPA